MVKAIPIIRGVYVNLFSDALAETGRLLETDVRQFDLPAGLAGKPDAYVPLGPVLAWLRWVAVGNGVEDLAVCAGARLEVTDFRDNLQKAILSAPTLEVALQRFCDLAHLEFSPARYRIEQDQDEVRISTSLDGISNPSLDLEWLQVMQPLTIIRHFAGEQWEPMTVSFQSQQTPGGEADEAFSHTHFLSGQAETSISFPASLFRLAIMTRQTDCGFEDATSDYPCHGSWDFPTSLRALLGGYLDENYPDVKLAAKISGCGVRTLQRRLQRLDLCYRDLVQEVQLGTATSLLRDSNMKVIDAAYAVGFSDPSHFTRAFRRLTGVNPSEYRKLSSARPRPVARAAATNVVAAGAAMTQ